MPRSVGTVIQNTLVKGLVTEATGLNFPENAVTSSDNTVFEKIGRATRRKGIDIEAGAVSSAYEDSSGVVREFVWQSVARSGGFTFLVVQVGFNVSFYEMSVNSSLSEGVVPRSVDLRDYKAPGAQEIQNIAATFASGNGYLFIAHPMCDTVLVRFNSDDDVFEAGRINLLIRDFEGVEDNLGTAEEPVTLSVEHSYNLRNQGWFKKVRVGQVNNEVGSDGITGVTPETPIDWEAL